jgi:hypothetical protein
MTETFGEMNEHPALRRDKCIILLMVTCLQTHNLSSRTNRFQNQLRGIPVLRSCTQFERNSTSLTKRHLYQRNNLTPCSRPSR